VFIKQKYFRIAFILVLLFLTCRNLLGQVPVDPRYILFDSSKNQWQIVDFNTVYEYHPDATEKYLRAYSFKAWFDPIPSPSGKLYFTSRNAKIYDPNPIDSIELADEILDIAFSNNQPTFAIIKNDTTHANYFVKKEDNKWSVTPVMFADHLKKNSYEPYFWLLFLLLPAALITVISRNRLINKEIKRSIVDQNDNPLLTKSEKPIGLNDEDLLGFNSLEDAVLSIIRNPQTELPMSIVISGDWGSGKSSMMNRIREKLETDPATNQRFMTSWFNAWHFQTENRLLDAFLLNIISSYDRNYKGFFEPFRLRLLLQRFQKQSPRKKFFFGFALAVVVPFVLVVFKYIFNAWFGFKGYQLQFLDSYESILYSLFVSGSFFSAQAIPTVGAGIIAIMSAFFLNKQLMPQGVSSLMSLLPKTSTKFDVERRQTGYREVFKKEYWEIIDAGEGTKRLVVFIDDIDRISGAKVLELLEAINFISDIASKAPGSKSRAPNTIFVLGMYAKEVTKNLGARLNEINNETDVKDPQQTGALYIEKMIQLIVPIPFDASKLNKLL
jgi:hypothetical protein